MNTLAMINLTFARRAPLPAIIEELQRRAKTCETASQDLTEAALTGGETSNKETNTQQAREWMLRSKVWLDAEAFVRELAEALAQPESTTTPPSRQPAPPA